MECRCSLGETDKLSLDYEGQLMYSSVEGTTLEIFAYIPVISIFLTKSVVFYCLATGGAES